MGLRLMKSRKRPFSILKDVTGAIKPVSTPYLPLTCYTWSRAATLLLAQLATHAHSIQCMPQPGARYMFASASALHVIDEAGRGSG